MTVIFFFYCITWHVGSYFRDQEGICTPCNGSTVLTWTARKVPTVGFKRKAVHIKVYIWNLEKWYR